MFKAIKTIGLLLMLLVVFFVAFFNYDKVHAEEITAGSLKINYPGAPGPLFSALNIAPGYEETRSIVVTNSGKVPHSFSLAVSGDLGHLSQVIIIEPIVLNSVVWSKTLDEIAKSPQSNVIVGSISPSGTANIQIRASMPESAGNEYQGAAILSFDFIMGNESTDQTEPSDEDGQIGDGGVSTQATGGISGLFARVSSSLQGGESNNNPAPQSTGNNGEVKGVKSSNDNGEAQGEESSNRQVCFWWWVLSLVLLVFLIIFGYFNRTREIIFAWVWPIFAGAVLYCVHWILHDYYAASKWCGYFILIELFLLALYYLQTVIWKPKSAQS